MDYQLIALLHMIVYALFVCVSKLSLIFDTKEKYGLTIIAFAPFIMALPSFLGFEIIFWLVYALVFQIFGG